MAKKVPSGFTVLGRKMAGGGAPSVERLTRALSDNGHFLYGHKGFYLAGWGETRVSLGHGTAAPDPYDTAADGVTVTTGDAITEHDLGEAYVPEMPVSGSRTVKAYVAFSAGGVDLAGGGLMNLIVDEDTGRRSTVSIIAGAISFTISDGARALRLRVVGTGAAGTVIVWGISLYFDRAKIGGSNPSFVALKQNVVAGADKPGDAYVYQRLMENQWSVLAETSSVFYSRWFGLPWNNNNATTKRIGWYYVSIPPSESQTMRIWLRVRSMVGQATVNLLLNGAIVNTQLVNPSTTYANIDFGAYSISADAKVEVTARAGSGTGAVVEVSGVYAWEQARTLTLPAGDAVPATYRGNDTDRMFGGFPALADLDGTDDAGFGAIHEDAIYLKKTRARMLICDWRHRYQMGAARAFTPGEIAKFLMNGIDATSGTSFTSTDGGKTYPNSGINTSDTGGSEDPGGCVIARAMVPAPGELDTLQVWLRVSFFASGGAERPTFDVRVHLNDPAFSSETWTIDPWSDGWEIGTSAVDPDAPTLYARWIGPFEIDRQAATEGEVVAAAVANLASWQARDRTIAAGGVYVGDYGMLCHGMAIYNPPRLEIP
jgi:hypothetical protein